MKFNCAPAHNQKIVVPTRKALLPLIEPFAPKVINIVFPTEELVNLIANFIGTTFNVNVLHATNSLILPGDMDVNAFYDAELDEEGKNPYEFVLITYPSDNALLWDYNTFYTVMHRVLDSVVHEMSHMKQARTRDFVDVSPMLPVPDSEKEAAQQYLGNFDEIDAYARNIADELSEFSTLIKRANWMQQPSEIPLEVSPNLWGYVNTFDKDIQHPVIKRLLKKVWKNLNWY